MPQDQIKMSDRKTLSLNKSHRPAAAPPASTERSNGLRTV